MTRSRTRGGFYSGKSDIETTALALLRAHLPYGKPVRLLGVTISNAAPVAGNKASSAQLELPLPGL